MTTLPFDHIDRVFPGGPGVIAEIGAADGLDTAKYAARYPHARIHAFEPLPVNVAKLWTLTERYKQVSVHPYALGDKSKMTAEFWVSGGTPRGSAAGPWPYSSSLLEPAEHKVVHPWCTFEKGYCTVYRLDEILKVAPNYIHMDVQGAELNVLTGAGELLNDVRAVWMEVADVALYKDQPLRRDVEEFMRSRGFVLSAYYGTHISGDQFWKRL